MTSNTLARFEHGIPVVASTAERDSLFATPNTDQRVFNKTSGSVERYSGTAWVIDGDGASIVTKTSAYTITRTDSTVLVDTTASNVNILLPAPTTLGTNGWYQRFTIKKISSDANNVNLTSVSGTDLIDGSVTLLINTQWVAVTIHTNGTTYYVI